MNFRPACLTLALVTAIAPVYAKAPNNPEYLLARKELQSMRGNESAAPATPTTVGDTDSFGRFAKFIGLMSTGTILMQSDCSVAATGPLGPEDHCVVTNPAPALTNTTLNDVARMIIPAKSSNSLFCHWQTPVVVYAFSNATGVYQPSARFVATPIYKFENAVLNDPSLIDPNTGLPYGGSFSTSLSGIRHARSLQPGEYQMERDTGTRSCIAGVVSKKNLMEGYGLTATQAANFFKNDTIITMSLQVQGAMLDFAVINYGTRFMGD